MSNAVEHGSSRISHRGTLKSYHPRSAFCNPGRRLFAGCDGLPGRRRGTEQSLDPVQDGQHDQIVAVRVRPTLQ